MALLCLKSTCCAWFLYCTTCVLTACSLLPLERPACGFGFRGLESGCPGTIAPRVHMLRLASYYLRFHGLQSLPLVLPA